MTTEQLNYIKENHKIKTARQIGRDLGICYSKVIYQAKKIGIKFNRYYDNSNLEQFALINDPTIAYFFGYLWADGSLLKSKGKNVGASLELSALDTDEIERIIKNKFVYSTHTRQRPNRKLQKSIIISDRNFAKWLEGVGFDLKSSKFPIGLANFIQPNIANYFWRGFFDGDGHVSDNHIQIAGSFDYNWDSLFEVFKSLGISKFHIRKYTSKENFKSSSIRLRKAESIKFLDFIYQNNDEIYLPRKYQKYKKLKAKENRFNKIINL